MDSPESGGFENPFASIDDAIPFLLAGGSCAVVGVGLMWDDVHDLADFWKDRADWWRPGQRTNHPIHHWLIGLFIFLVGLFLLVWGLLCLMV